jgi:hypothetical protein
MKRGTHQSHWSAATLSVRTSETTKQNIARIAGIFAHRRSVHGSLVKSSRSLCQSRDASSFRVEEL